MKTDYANTVKPEDTADASLTDEANAATLSSVDERYYNIPGSDFMIKYSDIRNMNISYIEIS